MAQWLSAWAETEGPCVWASLASLRYGPWARHIYLSLVLVQPRKTHPCLIEILLMGRKERNKQNWTHSGQIIEYGNWVLPHYKGLHLKERIRSLWERNLPLKRSPNFRKGRNLLGLLLVSVVFSCCVLQFQSPGYAFAGFAQTWKSPWIWPWSWKLLEFEKSAFCPGIELEFCKSSLKIWISLWIIQNTASLSDVWDAQKKTENLKKINENR